MIIRCFNFLICLLCAPPAPSVDLAQSAIAAESVALSANFKQDSSVIPAKTYKILVLLGAKARIESALEMRDTIQFPKALTESTHPQAKKIIHFQQQLFISQQKIFNNKIQIYNRHIVQLQAQIKGKKAQSLANQEEQTYVAEELKQVEVLAAKRLIKHTRLTTLKREFAVLKAKQSEIKTSIAALEYQIDELKLQIIIEKENRYHDLLLKLREIEQKLHSLS